MNSFILAILIFFSSLVGLSQTSDFYRCTGKISGEWNFGRAPHACNANSFGEDSLLYDIFAPVIFDDSVAVAGERARYMNEMNAVIQEAATYYIKKRKPQVSAQELAWWVLAIQATAGNESFWSQYRQDTDGRLKLMRGDYGHGHGMMQIDDRAHFPAVDKGLAWNLMSNLTYAMDLYYRHWEKAPSQSCVGSATNYQARVRSAWAAYNGGSAKFCRWTNPQDRWARNDQNFLDSLTGKRWSRYITDPNKQSDINIPCLMETPENCPRRNGPPTSQLRPGILYKTAKGSSCLLHAQYLHCVSDFRDQVCLRQFSDFNATILPSLPPAVVDTYPVVTYDRHELCTNYDSTLLKVASTLVLRKTINLRATPGGGILTVIGANTILPITDFEIRNPPNNDRYYKVRFKTFEGFIFGGTKTTQAEWVLPVSSNIANLVANVGQQILILNTVGINLRRSPGGPLIGHVPAQTRLQVLDRKVQGDENKVYYQISYQGQTGYIYAGLLLPASSVSQWTRKL